MHRDGYTGMIILICTEGLDFECITAGERHHQICVLERLFWI